ncbi:MAG: DNA replication/repair protein RecF [Clostridia bacterium]|nr:DNA replication/repair protein RecF [Clostridia bacterium]
MLIKNLELIDFRNYKNCKFTYQDGINIVSGRNAQGKTNSAEAIFYLCTGYSPRATKDRQVIFYGEEKATVKGEAETRFGKVKVEIEFFKDKNKAVRINGVQVAKIGELLGNVNSVFFSPEELKLVKESPEDRRRFMDISLSQLSKGYFYALQKYKKILVQRNVLLKDEQKDMIFETLPIWDEQLSAAGAKIIFKRKEFIKKLAPHAEAAHSAITGGEEELKISLESGTDGETEEEIKEKLFSALSERVETDIERGHTSIGPHRDDIKIKLGGVDVRIYGSQGQQRTAALSLKLAETEIFKDEFGEYPVLILDDALSELDLSRRQRLMAAVEKMQTIITCTEPEGIPNYEKYNNIKIKNGEII